MFFNFALFKATPSFNREKERKSIPFVNLLLVEKWEVEKEEIDFLGRTDVFVK